MLLFGSCCRSLVQGGEETIVRARLRNGSLTNTQDFSNSTDHICAHNSTFRMKSALTVVLFRLFTIGVFVDGKEASNVSVMEGDSVSLKSGVTDVKTDDDIEWRFNGNRIDKSVDSLQLDSQTGDLKISNIRTKDSGLYKVKISSTRGFSEMEFNVKVVSADEETSVIVMEGDSVTLHPDPTYIQGYDVIRWRFGQQKSLVAEINRTAGIFNTYDGPDGRFRDRLQLDHQTGSLNITNSTTTDSGLYEAEISSTRSRYTIHHTQSFSVTVSDEVESVSVLEGDSVTLRTGLTKRQIIEQILWKFEDNDEPIADLNDLQTGDLTIRNIQRDQYGYYNAEIKTRTMILHRKYQITMIAVPDAGMSPGAVAGIVVAVVVVLLVVAAAGVVKYYHRVAGVVMYYRRKISEPERQREENGVNRNTQKTDDPATEETKLNDS